MKATKILIAGDLMPMPCNYDLFEAGDTQALFGEKLCALFASADVRVCNLEGCFTDSNAPIEKIGPNIKAPVSTVKAIKDLGINYATLGNTHSMDYGKQGYLDTCRALRDNGIAYFGWGENAASVKAYAVIEDGGRKIILYNTTERFENAPGEDYPYHGGIEGTHCNSEKMRTRFRRMADNGADVVISQHTHAVGEEERCGSAYFLYGQGNFCFHFRPDVTPLLAEGLVLELDVTDDGFTATPHRILRTEKGCVYDDEQDLSAFYERSQTHDALVAGDKAAMAAFDEQFGKDCANWATVFFSLFRGANPQDMEQRKALSSADYLQYMKSSYTRQQLLGMQMFMRNEEFNEVGNRILSDLLKETDTKEI